VTALDRYVRLEAVGLWREAPGAEAREVVVSFGKTTLMLTDLAERPLGHWALAGVSVLGRADDGATIYAMTADGSETLAIRDRDMIAAIAAVMRRPPPPPRRRRRLPVGPIVAVAALAAVLATAPRLIRTATVRLVPPEQAAEIGDRMLISLIERHGPPCDDPGGERALGRLAAALDPAVPPRLRVMALGGPMVAALPGRTVLIDPGALATATPDEIAGRVVQALEGDPVAALVRNAGLVADLRYVFSGHFDDRALARAAESATSTEVAGTAPGAPVPGTSDWQALLDICERA
jgi:hypothetical protein